MRFVIQNSDFFPGAPGLGFRYSGFQSTGGCHSPQCDR